jgi:hypothetical protein
MKLKSVASLKGPLACSIILILKTYFLSLTAMGCGGCPPIPKNLFSQSFLLFGKTIKLGGREG